MTFYYHHGACGSDFTPAKIAGVIGWEKPFEVSLTPTHIVVRGEEYPFALTARHFGGRWEEKESWIPTSRTPLIGEMRFSPVCPHGRPGRFPAPQEVLDMWGSSRDFLLDINSINSDVSNYHAMMSVKRNSELVIQPVAVLSTTVLPVDGMYEIETIDITSHTMYLGGVPHYIGHPATKEIVEKLGAIPAEEKLFPGLQPGEVAVCFAIAQGKSTRAKDGFTSPHQEVTADDLTCRVIRRVR